MQRHAESAFHLRCVASSSDLQTAAATSPARVKSPGDTPTDAQIRLAVEIAHCTTCPFGSLPHRGRSRPAVEEERAPNRIRAEGRVSKPV